MHKDDLNLIDTLNSSLTVSSGESYAILQNRTLILGDSCILNRLHLMLTRSYLLL